MTYKAILTDIGRQRQSALLTGERINITAISIGDGGGSAVENPDGGRTTLINEVWRGALSKVETHEVNNLWTQAEGYIPAATGPFWVREVGLWDDSGSLIVIGNFPPTYKPSLEEGAGKDLWLQVIFNAENADTIELYIDPSAVFSTTEAMDAQDLLVAYEGESNAASISRIIKQQMVIDEKTNEQRFDINLLASGQEQLSVIVRRNLLKHEAKDIVLRQSGEVEISAAPDPDYRTDYVSVNFTEILPIADYQVITSREHETLGAIVAYDKSVNGFKLRAKGSGGGTVSWRLIN